MGRIIIKNTTVLTLDDQDSFFYPGYVEIRNDRIWQLGPWTEGAALGDYDGETEVVDGTDKLVMPGMVDLHFHTSIAKVGPQVPTCYRALRGLSKNTDANRGSTMTCPSGSIWTRSGIQPSER